MLNCVRIEYLRARARLDANTRVLRGLRKVLIIIRVTLMRTFIRLPMLCKRAHFALQKSPFRPAIKPISCHEMGFIGLQNGPFRRANPSKTLRRNMKNAS